MDQKLIKRFGFKDLHLPTLLKIVDFTHEQKSVTTMCALMHGNKGSYSPTRTTAKVEALEEYAGFLQKIAEVLKLMQDEGE